ncbi:MAG: hypothetical protein O9340_10320 [Cyclobacteriaceae bacterium]|nr:hypothetical protein [Cyclobacteriaceae bacterium]
MKQLHRFSFLVFLLLNQIASGQIKKIVLSRNSKIPVRFAEISNLTIGFLTYSNENGEFFIPENSYTTDFTITADFHETIKSAILTDTIYLSERISVLPELVIHDNELDFKTVGYSGKKSKGSFIGSQTLAVKFKNLPVNSFVNQINLRINHSKKESELPDQLLVKLILSYPNEKGEPEEVGILPFTISKTIDYETKNLVFDISHLNLRITKNEVFCGLQFLGYFKNGVFIDFKDSRDFNKIIYRVPFSDINQNIESWVRDNVGKWIPFTYQNSKCQFNFSMNLLLD